MILKNSKLKTQNSKEKKISKIVLFAAVTILGTAVLGVNIVKADESSDRHSTIISKLVAKFGLNQADVEAVFEEERGERQAQMQVKKTERLNQLVADGKLTEDQKNLLITKQEEMKGQFEGMRDLSPEERKAQMEAHRDEMHNWAEANGIDLEAIGPLGGFGKGIGREMKR